MLFPDFTNKDKLNNIKIPDVGNWLIKIFDLWYEDKDMNKIKIDPFIDIINLIFGNEDFGNEAFGRHTNGTLVIETDGSIELVDTLKICENGITKVNFNIFDNNLNDIYSNDLAKIFYYGNEILCNKCKQCFLSEVCGGGYIAHRYAGNSHFNHPTVYCKDMAILITHIQNRIFDDLPEKLKPKINKLEIDEVIEYIQKN